MADSALPLRDRVRAALAALGLERADVGALLALALCGVATLALVWWLQDAGSVREPGPVDGQGAAGLRAAGDPTDLPPGVGVGVGQPTELVVHVAGAVAAPGLLRLPAGARVADALESAGGPLPEAWLDAVNLARPLSDGEQLVVPVRGEVTGAEGAPPPVPAAPGGILPDGTVDLNRATPAELETLPGVGPVTAGRIVEHREANGPFTAVGQLRDVHGIGEKTFQALAELVGV
jgi:competence protein ComEA